MYMYVPTPSYFKIKDYAEWSMIWPLSAYDVCYHFPYWLTLNRIPKTSDWMPPW
jgi:hypothetical protein